ncbi:alpha-protein kinase 3 [Scomber scombrus]|uniref:alpha-protein kinase 3 n=1 Tax=Scomber scombrus TaxID=13677 RepID=UPI002DD93268|nr:alpha-protein kinase 3 [Scomber scombrus]
MTSRRPMTRSFSGNGRTSSFSEEEGGSSNGRSESRNTYLSNVRPENSYSRYSHYRPTRSTLCSVMAQLTEDIQPSFESTLKSKAVSENCNVKFTCVVSGYPAPELKWYKDDMEMDRYCGLPKYEIRRNGKIHTLHIYNCTLDDAAIYQVSASNSKGIVSCSGVLEVGTMNEYKIHQRFFSKLKQKAEKKKRDLEDHTKKGDKENFQREKPRGSPERPQRKRPVPQPEPIPAVKEPETVKQVQAAAEPNGVSSEVKETAPVTSTESAMEKETPPSEVTLATKKIKITNGLDDTSSNSSNSRSHMMGNGGENCYDGGISLAQFLAETLQSQTNDEKQNSPREEKPREMDTPIVNASKDQEKKQKEREEQEKILEEEYEIEKKREQELDIEREKEKERLSEMLNITEHQKHDSVVKHHSKAHKDHDHHNIHTSISSMLHTVKDFLFGKGKKDSYDHIENKGREFDHSPTSTHPRSQTPPSFWLQPEHHPEVDKPLTEEVVPMETDKPQEPLETVDIEQQSVSTELLTPHKHKHEDSVLHTDVPPAHKLPPESIEESTGQSVKEADDTVEAMEVSEGAESSGPHEEMSLSGLQVLTEGEEKDSQLPLDHQDLDCLVVSPQPNQQSAQDESSPREAISVLPQTQAHHEEECPLTSTLTSLKDSQATPCNVISATDSHCLSETPTEPVQEEEMSVDKKGKETEPDTEEGHSSTELYKPKPVETTKVPLFVVPPISVTCDESDLRLPTQCESTETETSAAKQRETKPDVDNNATTKPEKTQNKEELAEKSTTENTPSVLHEAPIPKLGDNVPSLSKTTEDNIIPEILKTKPLKEAKVENSVTVEDLLKNRSSVERLTFKPPTHPSLSPASLRKFMSKSAPDSDNEAMTTVPVITLGDRQSDKADEDLSGGSTPTSSLSCENSPRLKRRDSLSLIRSATPEELASGARRKIFIPKPKEDGEGVDTQSKKETPYMSPSQARRAALLQAPMGQNTPPMERRSPLLSRRKATLEVPKVVEEIPTEEPVSTKQEKKHAEKKLDPLKAPQVIRKIRGEPFPDASGHLKLWCQFFNVLSDSTIKWYRDEEEILEVKRSGGDESQVALAIVLASSPDCGVYGCTIKNEYGTDTTDYLLSVDILSEILLKDDLEVGEEIEMTPLLFNKSIADCGNWGNKYFGRIMSEMVNIGEGCAHKASRVKVIYGLNPVFESGSTCIIKVQNPIGYGTKQESNLAERNLEITRQECKIQNLIREYCKIFVAEARVLENFGHSLEVIPQYLMYRPANSVPYATVEADLKGVFLKYCMMDPKGRLITRTISEVEQKCCTFQHWIHQWTHGNLLVTQLEGVEMKITNVRVVTKSKGYQGLTECGSPQVFEQFLTQHKCNYYCGLLGLRPLKTMDSLQQPSKMKGSRSPLLNRKLSTGSGSPQLQRKGHSPQMSRKATSSPKVTRKVQEIEDNKSGAKLKTAETLNVLETR